MRKINLFNVVILFALIMSTSSIYGQGGYLNISAGYGFQMSSGNLGNFYIFRTTNSSNTYKQVNLSLGKGFNFGGAVGLMFNKNIGAELGITYLIGAKSKAQDSYIGGQTDYKLSARMLRINPSLVISAGYKVINPYAKMGVLIGLGSVNEEIVDNAGGDLTEGKIKMNGRFALGANAGVGLLCKLNKRFYLFGELNMINMSYAPTKGKLTEATLNGVDILSHMTTSDKETEYVDSYTDSQSNPQLDSQPTKAMKVKIPFGSVGAILGFRICF